ncbi:MAG: hypothetical protein NUV86_07315, partial [Candidatus Scalindua sp.]|nr:hypothetical protein [Candidatus Scalindua sp.]MCR4345531.1 hypothetical protein [Candidatus Scalindua sp.]
MRMFLVGMCDIFLILYLTTLSQVNPFHNSFLTVDDYNKLKESKVRAEQGSEKSHAQILELNNEISVLDKEKEKALQSTLSAKAETEKIKQLVTIEKEKIAKIETELSTAINEKKEFNRLLQKSQEDEQKTLKLVNESQAESEKAREREQSALKTLEETRIALEKAREKELYALQIVKAVKIEAERSKEDEQKALETAEKLRLKAEDAKRKAEDALKLAKEARLKEEDARKSEEIARKIAEKERLNAVKASENEAIALNIAKLANNQKEIALKNAHMAREAEANALGVARIAQGETAKVKSKIQSIIRPADKAYNENIIDKLVQFTITIGYKDSQRVLNKVITMQGLPVKMGEEYVLFALLDQIGLDPSATHDNYVTYNITVNDKPVTKLFVKPGEVKMAALVISDEIEHCLPVGKTAVFSSYMPVLISLRNHQLLGVMDRIRGVSKDYFIFKRDQLLMITENEFYFDHEGFRGTGNYAEYIVEGDQIVDLGGSFIGFA